MKLWHLSPSVNSIFKYAGRLCDKFRYLMSWLNLRLQKQAIRVITYFCYFHSVKVAYWLFVNMHMYAILYIDVGFKMRKHLLWRCSSLTLET